MSWMRSTACRGASDCSVQLRMQSGSDHSYTRECIAASTRSFTDVMDALHSRKELATGASSCNSRTRVPFLSNRQRK